MAQGRPASNPRTALGTRIVEARKEKNLTQQDLANKLDVSQRVIAHWERQPVALKPEQLSALADALNVTADYLIGRTLPKQRGSGPKGKAKLLFEKVSKLPRTQQDKIFDLLEPFISAHTKV